MIEIKGNEEVLEGLIAYTQRHFNRLGRLEIENHMLGYTSYRMSAIEPEGKIENKDVTLCTGQIMSKTFKRKNHQKSENRIYQEMSRVRK
uniref:U3 small nucleolar RNA-associated protein n=1 Tax=Solanum tuberosum TaxID=4113 RepID=M0ZX74_SOLTU